MKLTKQHLKTLIKETLRETLKPDKSYEDFLLKRKQREREEAELKQKLSNYYGPQSERDRYRRPAGVDIYETNEPQITEGDVEQLDEIWPFSIIKKRREEEFNKKRAASIAASQAREKEGMEELMKWRAEKAIKDRENDERIQIWKERERRRKEEEEWRKYYESPEGKAEISRKYEAEKKREADARREKNRRANQHERNTAEEILRRERHRGPRPAAWDRKPPVTWYDPATDKWVDVYGKQYEFRPRINY